MREGWSASAFCSGLKQDSDEWRRKAGWSNCAASKLPAHDCPNECRKQKIPVARATGALPDRNDGKPDQREVEPAEPLPLPEVSEPPDVLELPEEPAGLVGLDG